MRKFSKKRAGHQLISGHSHGQMSEAFSTAAFLSISGGLQDAYTYFFRGGVFANAQTGNIVQLSQNLGEQNWAQALHYLIPLSAFACGVMVTELIRQFYQNAQNVHWRQLVLVSEILLLFLVGFLPQHLDMPANALVSFSCAMQVQAFRKVTGYSFSSTMCIGNMRCAIESLAIYLRTHDRTVLRKSLRYWEIIFLFGFGAGLGSYGVSHFGARTIWLSCLLLLISFFLMFIREENPEDTDECLDCFNEKR